MNVLCAMEYSGIVRDAFIARGHFAISCDLLPTENTGPHHQGDIYEMLNRRWDLIIAHPECTKVSVCGNGTYSRNKPKHQERIQSAAWIEKFWFYCCRHADGVCFENPVGVLPTLTDMPKPFYIQPYEFGHTEQKKTALFLHNLSPLTETNNVYDDMMRLPKKERERIFYMSPSDDRGKRRAATYPGIAEAMADQWG